MSEFNIIYAQRPRSLRSCLIVVRGGVRAAANLTSSKPTTLISFGTLKPCNWHSEITPFAIVSLPQRIAVAPAAIKFET